MYIEPSDEVCCSNIVTANKHISIWNAEYYVPWPSTIRLKLKFQPSNRFMMEYSVSKISLKGIFFFMCDFITKCLQ